VRDFSFDVWDALDLEAQLPVPAYFRPDPDAENASEDATADIEEVPHALPRRYWAKAIMGVIARHYTLQSWARLYSTPDTEDDPISFEEGLAGMSAFFDESPKQIPGWLGQIASQCRHLLTSAGVELDPEDPKYDVQNLCVQIRAILRDMGFRNAEGTDFYDLLNQFPHALMRENHRRTIPMSLVYVFVSVSRRLGVRASPTNFPGKVLCHIAPADPQGHEMLFDLCGNAPPFVFSSNEPQRMLLDVGLPMDARHDLIRPCRVGTILHRAAANLIIAVRWNQRRTKSAFTEKYAWCSYAAFSVVLLESQDNQILSHIMDSKPLDALAVLADVVCPALIPSTCASLTKHCMELVQSDEDYAKTLWVRSEHTIKYFVGMIVRHSLYDYIGCIIGWHPLCFAKEDLTPVLEVQRLAGGWSQPFYWVITADGAKRYVAEEDLSPINVTKDLARKMFESRTIFGRFFEDVQEDEKHQRGRLLPSEELRVLFPEDDDAGASWIAEDHPDEGVPSRAEAA